MQRSARKWPLFGQRQCCSGEGRAKGQFWQTESLGRTRVLSSRFAERQQKRPLPSEIGHLNTLAALKSVTTVRKRDLQHGKYSLIQVI